MELTYTKVGDYYIPDLVLDDQPDRPLGRYGRMRQKFLEKHHPVIYSNLMLSGIIFAKKDRKAEDGGRNWRRERDDAAISA